MGLDQLLVMKWTFGGTMSEQQKGEPRWTINRSLMPPTRSEVRNAIVLAMYERGEPASASDLASTIVAMCKRTDLTLGTILYHFKELVKHGVLLFHHDEPRRGAVKHFFVLLPGVVVPDADWALDEIAGALDAPVSEIEALQAIRAIVAATGRGE